MDDSAESYARLALLVQRILDTEVLFDTDSATLQREVEAALRSQEAGDTEAARQHVEQVALFTEALVRTHLLAPSQGRVVLETTDRLLTTDNSSKEA